VRKLLVVEGRKFRLKPRKLFEEESAAHFGVHASPMNRERQPEGKRRQMVVVRYETPVAGTGIGFRGAAALAAADCASFGI